MTFCNMEFRHKQFFSLAIFAISIALILQPNNAISNLLLPTTTAVNPFCKAAENKTLCTSIVQAATTWQSATANAVSKALEIAKQGKPMLDDLTKELSRISLSRISKESIGYTCNEIYDFAIECLKGALDDLRYGYRDRLETKLSSVTGPSSECTNALKKYGVVSQLSEFFSVLGLYVSNCLSVARAG